MEKAIKTWLQNHPYDPSKELPIGWEFRFGMRGMFLKYNSIEHAETRNKDIIRETCQELPFSYCNREWEKLKANLKPNDEIWRYGGDGGEAIFIIRNGQQVKDDYGNCRDGHYVILSYY